MVKDNLNRGGGWMLERQSLEVSTVQLAGGREFRAQMIRAADGEPQDLVLSVSYASDGLGWRTQAGTLALPPESLPHVRAALEALERESDQ